jgi:drug/metabolite transporter (DMT)-like permease
MGMSAVTASLSERRDHPTLGIVTFVGNLLSMAFLSAMVKHMSTSFPLSEILLFRFVFASALFWVILFFTGGPPVLRTSRPLDHAIRSLSGVVSLALMYFALARIPIADATALSYAAPIFITVLSIFVLKETIGFRRWLAVISGFIGVLLIAQPGGAGWSIGVAAAAGSAVTAAIVAIWLRRLSSSERSVTIGIYYNTSGVVLCLIWTLFSGAVMPQGMQWSLLLVFGLFCAGQQWLQTISFRYAEASLLAPFEYLAMIFAAIIGFVFWGEIPVFTTWLGALVIAASGLFIFKRKQQNK